MDNYHSLRILKQGSIGFICQKGGCTYNGSVVDKVTVEETDIPVLMSVAFLQGRRPSYNVKSLEYCVTYGLSNEQLIASLKKSKGDYEYFCFLKDKCQNIPDEF